MEKDPMDRGFWGGIAPGPVDGWMIYCFLLTCWVPGFILRSVFGTLISPQLAVESKDLVILCTSNIGGDGVT